MADAGTGTGVFFITNCSRCEISALLCSQKRQAGKGRFFSDHWVNLKLTAVHTVPTEGESLRGRVVLLGAALVYASSSTPRLPGNARAQGETLFGSCMFWSRSSFNGQLLYFLLCR